MNYWKYNHPGKNLFVRLIFIFLILGACLLVFFNKDDLFFTLNKCHSYAADIFFSYFTHIGDGLFMLGLGVIMLGLGKRKMGVLLILSFLLSGLFVQVGKRFKPEPRPGRYYAEINRIHKVHDQPLMGNNSFPSGHTTTAFAMFTILALYSKNKGRQMLFFLLALSVGYSRIYLGHHFFKDVYFGAMLGFTSVIILFWILRNKDFGGNVD
jgi:membrane-associated phospholipid phosphatase